MPTKSQLSTTTEKNTIKEFAKPLHPGEILLEEFLIPLGLTQVAFAKRIGWPSSKLNELVRGRRGITAESAIVISEALGTSAKFWMNLQASFDLHRARAARQIA